MDDRVPLRGQFQPILGGEGLDQSVMPVMGVEQEAFLVAAELCQAVFITSSGREGEGQCCLLFLTCEASY